MLAGPQHKKKVRLSRGSSSEEDERDSSHKGSMRIRGANLKREIKKQNNICDVERMLQFSRGGDK